MDAGRSGRLRRTRGGTLSACGTERLSQSSRWLPWNRARSKWKGGADILVCPRAGRNACPTDRESCKTIDLHGAWITPGLIDCHTHLVYGGNRVGEIDMRLCGVSYAEIARQGGGIVATVRATRAFERIAIGRSGCCPALRAWRPRALPPSRSSRATAFRWT